MCSCGDIRGEIGSIGLVRISDAGDVGDTRGVTKTENGNCCTRWAEGLSKCGPFGYPKNYGRVVIGTQTTTTILSNCHLEGEEPSSLRQHWRKSW